MPLLPTVFRLASRTRGARAFHPRGVVLHATWRPAIDGSVLVHSPLLARPRSALVRLSHGIGFGPRSPDVLGLAVRVVDVHGPGRHQDLLFASSGAWPGTRRLLRPARDFTRTPLSTLLPYEVAGLGRRPLVASAAPGSTPTTYGHVLRHGPQRVPWFEVRIGSLRGPRLATLVPGARVSLAEGDAIRYDPWNTGPELRPVGLVNRLRAPTYAASQDGRGAPRAAGGR